MANLKKQALRLQEQEEARQKRLELARARAQNAAGGALAVTAAAVPAGWNAPKAHDAFAFARDFQLEHPDVARIRRMPVPGSKLTVIHVRGQHLALRDLSSAGRVRATQEEMYRVAAALVERGDVAAGHVENWCASDVGVVRKETAKSFYRNKHEEIFVKATKERVGELPEAVREALAKGPQVGDPVYGTLAKLHFEGKLALLPSSVEALENELADEYARTADARRTPESAEGVKAALSPEGDVSRRNDEREDECLRQALRPEFAPFGDVRLVCDGATHDYLANGRRMGVSVVEITVNSIHRALGTPPEPETARGPMSAKRKAIVAALVLAALGGGGAAAWAAMKTPETVDGRPGAAQPTPPLPKK